MQRRDFLKAAAASTAAVAASKLLAGDAGPTTRPGNPARLARRKYGRHGVELSIIGFGGIVVRDADPAHAARVVAEFVERGINYFDVAPQYGDAQEKLGPALAPFRKQSFLACKTLQRDAAGAKADFERSLDLLKTDYFDLYQLHALTDVKKDVDAAFARGGVIEFIDEAKKSGQIRHVGFSAHSVDAALAAMDRYEFDSILTPISYSTFYAGGFGPQMIEQAVRKGVSCLALKALARQRWSAVDPGRKQFPKCWYEPITDRREADLALRFTLSQPVTAAIPPGEESLFRMAVDLAAAYHPITPAEDQALREMAGDLRPIFSAG